MSTYKDSFAVSFPQGSSGRLVEYLLYNLLSGSSKELELIFKHEKDHKLYLRNLELQVNEQRYKRVIMLRERAKKHIWGAVNRKDTKAIEIMISRGID
jgi:hypothetical protein